MRHLFIGLWMLFGMAVPAVAQVSVGVGIALPGVSIGIHLPAYPTLVPIPGYPVYYAPRLNLNFFFYDGLYWVYQADNWYVSSWYNGPWALVVPEVVPLFILRVPVRYYRYPPTYFLGWRTEAPPRWGEHWGPDWEQRRSGWDRWTRSAAPARAPLPVYQRQYSGPDYPPVEQQQSLHDQKYRYQPRDALVRQYSHGQSEPRVLVPREPQAGPAAPQRQPPQGGVAHPGSEPVEIPRQRGPSVREKRSQQGREGEHEGREERDWKK